MTGGVHGVLAGCPTASADYGTTTSCAIGSAPGHGVEAESLAAGALGPALREALEGVLVEERGAA